MINTADKKEITIESPGKRQQKKALDAVKEFFMLVGFGTDKGRILYHKTKGAQRHE